VKRRQERSGGDGTSIADAAAIQKEVPVIRKLMFAAVVVCAPSMLLAQTTQSKPPIVKKGGAPVTRSSDGPQMFASYCAACHGKTGKGDGPAAPALTPKPADLTQLTKKYGKGTFPLKDFEDKVNGMAMASAHGSTDMPVWGPILRQMGNEQMRLYNLRKYVEGLQTQ
jgi:mono/diheme cytochrome c family protein